MTSQRDIDRFHGLAERIAAKQGQIHELAELRRDLVARMVEREYDAGGHGAQARVARALGVTRARIAALIEGR